MNRSQKGWTRIAFGDVVQLSKERSKNPEVEGLRRYVGLEHLKPGDLKIRRWGDITDGTTFTNVFRPGQVLFGKRRAYQRKVAVADFSGVCSGDIYILEPNSKNLISELLPFICQTDAFFDHAVGTSAGSLSPRTNWKSLATYEFLLPPLDEQRRIAEVLQGIQTCVETCRLAYEKAFRIRVKMCMNISRFAASSSGSECHSVESAFECLDSRRVPLNESQRNENRGNTPYYGATGQVDTVGDYIFDESLILVAEDGGPFNEFDEKPVAYAIHGKSWVNNHAHVLRPRNSQMMTWLLMNLMHCDLRRFTTGTTRGKLNKEQLFQVPIWIPDTQIVRVHEYAFMGLGVALEKLERRINNLQDLHSVLIRSTLGEGNQ